MFIFTLVLCLNHGDHATRHEQYEQCPSDHCSEYKLWCTTINYHATDTVKVMIKKTTHLTPPPPPPPQVRCQLEDGTSWTNGLMTWSRDALAADTVGPEWSTSAAGPDQTLTTTHLQVKLKNILEWGWHSRTGLLEDLTSQFSNLSLRIRS